MQMTLDDVHLLGEELFLMERQRGEIAGVCAPDLMRELSHLKKAQYYEIKDFLNGYATQGASSGLTEKCRSGKKHGSLYWLMDETKTGHYGGRMLRLDPASG